MNDYFLHRWNAAGVILPFLFGLYLVQQYRSSAKKTELLKKAGLGVLTKILRKCVAYALAISI